MSYTYSGDAIRGIPTRTIQQGLNLTPPDDNSDGGGSAGDQFIGAARESCAAYADDGNYDGYEPGDIDYSDEVCDFIADYENKDLAEAWADLYGWDYDGREGGGGAIEEIRSTMLNMASAIFLYLLGRVGEDYDDEEDEDDYDSDEEYEEAEPDVPVSVVIPGLVIPLG